MCERITLACSREAYRSNIEVLQAKKRYTPAFRSVSLEGLRILIDMLGPPTFGILRLLAHWASRTDVKVPEDELLAELRSVGADEWEEAGTEAERSVEELARLRSSRTEG